MADETNPTEAPAEAAPAAPEAAAPQAAAPEAAAPEATVAAGSAPPEGRRERGARGGRGGGRDNRGGGNRGRRDDNRRGGRGGDDDGGEELIEKLVHINRVSKTVKGGKRFGFAALVVVGDGKGRAGFGHGKAREVPEAISKATAAAKKAMVRVPLRDGRTLHHDGLGHFGAGRVYVRSAPAGTGIIAGGPMRAVFESLGVADVVTKSIGTSNPYNMIRATFEALERADQPEVGRAAPRQQDRRPDGAPRGPQRRRGGGRGRGGRGVSMMAKIKITQTGSPIRRTARSAQDADRPRASTRCTARSSSRTAPRCAA